MLGLNTYLERYPRQLSGGQRQRVAMGRAMVRDPKVFLFDEPLSNLDAKLRVQMRSEIKQNHQRLKTTTVYVTHDQIEAMTMADRIVVMHDGVVEQLGSPLELYDHPANLFVAGFIGSPAMNVLPGRTDDGVFVAEDGTRITLRKGGPNVAEVRLGIRPEHFRLDADGLAGRDHHRRADRVRDPGAPQAGRARACRRLPRAHLGAAGRDPADQPRSGAAAPVRRRLRPADRGLRWRSTRISGTGPCW